jgi:SAM-dependent methyltransferase
MQEYERERSHRMTGRTSEHAASTYVFDPGWRQEWERLRAIEAIWDANTFARLEAIGIGAGWRCLEVGAGSGSVAGWLCRRVRPDGQVVATDLDTRFLELLDAPNLEVRHHDITLDDIEEGAYDLVHTRLLLEHLPRAEVALGKMVKALTPGGHLLVEEFDHVTFLPDPARAEADKTTWQQFLDAFEVLSRRRGLDLVFGRRLFGLLRTYQLEDVQAGGVTVTERGGSAGRGLLRLSVLSLREALLDTMAIDEQGVDRLVSLLEDPGFSWTSQLMVSAQGRRA